MEPFPWVGISVGLHHLWCVLCFGHFETAAYARVHMQKNSDNASKLCMSFFWFALGMQRYGTSGDNHFIHTIKHLERLRLSDECTKLLSPLLPYCDRSTVRWSKPIYAPALSIATLTCYTSCSSDRHFQLSGLDTQWIEIRYVQLLQYGASGNDHCVIIVKMVGIAFIALDMFKRLDEVIISTSRVVT